jgi:hypothetical protein
VVLQDTRVWGNTDQRPMGDNNSFSVYEVWAQYNFTPKISIRLGRQEFSYDNQEIFTNSKAYQEGQSHDAVKIKYAGIFDIVLVGAYNNNTSINQLYKIPYTLANYKNLQFLRISKKGEKFSGNFMALNSGLEYYESGQIDSIRTNYYQTIGMYFKYFLSKRLFTTNSFYYQTGNDQYNLNLAAFSIYSQFSFIVKPKTFIVSLGINVYSGNTKNTSVNTNNSYSMSYGNITNNGGLPGFYTISGPRAKMGIHKGLIQPKAELSYIQNKLTVIARVHLPHSYGELYNSQDEETNKFLGTEYEIFAFYQLSKGVKLSAVVGHYLMGGNIENLSHVALGNYSDFKRNPLWIIFDFSFTFNFFKS